MLLRVVVALVCVVGLVALAACYVLAARPPCVDPDDCFANERCVKGACVTNAGGGEGEGAAAEGEGAAAEGEGAAAEGEGAVAEGEGAAGEGEGEGGPDVFAFPPFDLDVDATAIQPADDAVVTCSIVVDTDAQTVQDDGGSGTDCITGAFTLSTAADGAVVLSSLALTVDDGASIFATGSKPLVLAVFGNAIINGGIDAGPHQGAGPGERTAGCDAQNGQNGSGGGGGGGGGLRVDGAKGGTGEGTNGGNGGRTIASLEDTRLGGCDGADGGTGSSSGTRGARGVAGGAVQIDVAGTLTISSTGFIAAPGGGGGGGHANGCGDSCGGGGGGGGGSGGWVRVEAGVLVVSGAVTANGGGGGQGARGHSDESDTGETGDLGSTKTTAAANGGNSSNGAPGGAGGADTLAPVVGSNFADEKSGGGGGGGGSGIVVMRSLDCAGVGGVVSPPSTCTGF